jgi:Kef-type K+ transport system membrane component KefB
MGMLFYVAQLLRLSPDGLALTNRLAGAIYLSLSLVAGVGAAAYLSRRFWGKFWRIAMVAALVLVNYGSAAAVVTARTLPGPYKVEIFSRRINTEGFELANWARDVLGPKHHFGADAINMLILSSYGGQELVTEISNGLFIEQSIYLSPQFSQQEMVLLGASDVHYSFTAV